MLPNCKEEGLATEGTCEDGVRKRSASSLPATPTLEDCWHSSSVLRLRRYPLSRGLLPYNSEACAVHQAAPQVKMERATMPTIKIIGAGLAGSEAAWQCARRGVDVELFEMRPVRSTPAHQTGDFAELVCS